jgi:hypothetical protein
MAAPSRDTTTRNISHLGRYITNQHSFIVTVQKCTVVILLTGNKASARYYVSNSACYKTYKHCNIHACQHHGLPAHIYICQLSRIDYALIHGWRLPSVGGCTESDMTTKGKISRCQSGPLSILHAYIHSMDPGVCQNGSRMWNNTRYTELLQYKILHSFRMQHY